MENEDQSSQTECLLESTFTHWSFISRLLTWTPFLFPLVDCDDFTTRCLYSITYIYIFFIMSLCPCDISFITESVSCRLNRELAWWRAHQIWRSRKNWSGWVSTSSRNDQRRSPCRQYVEAARRNRSRAVQEMNLFKSKVAGQAIKVRLGKILRGMTQGRVHAQIPCRPRYQEELPACRLLLNNVRGGWMGGGVTQCM